MMRDKFDYIIEYFINTKMMLGDGCVYMKNHGIPSGSSFTSLIGSVINILITRTLFRMQNITAIKDKFLGDDSYSYLSYDTYKKLDHDRLIDHAKRFANLTLHPEKIKVARK